MSSLLQIHLGVASDRMHIGKPYPRTASRKADTGEGFDEAAFISESDSNRNTGDQLGVASNVAVDESDAGGQYPWTAKEDSTTKQGTEGLASTNLTEGMASSSNEDSQDQFGVISENGTG